MKTNQLFLLTGLATVALPACVQKDKKEVSEKPMNILYIMCDDHSYQTISAYDHRFIETPNIGLPMKAYGSRTASSPTL